MSDWERAMEMDGESIRRLVAMLRRLEWAGDVWTHDGTAPACPLCHADAECPHYIRPGESHECGVKVHEPDCELDALLREYAEAPPG